MHARMMYNTDIDQFEDVFKEHLQKQTLKTKRSVSEVVKDVFEFIGRGFTADMIISMGFSTAGQGDVFFSLCREMGDYAGPEHILRKRIWSVQPHYRYLQLQLAIAHGLAGTTEDDGCERLRYDKLDVDEQLQIDGIAADLIDLMTGGKGEMHFRYKRI